MGKGSRVNTTGEILAKVAEIQEVEDDPEQAHAMEDDLYIQVLRAIADGAENAAELAEAALQSQLLDFDRWTA